MFKTCMYGKEALLTTEELKKAITPERKVLHIVVHDGLIQSIYSENVTIDDVVIYDLDTDDNEEYDELSEAAAKLPDIAYRVY